MLLPKLDPSAIVPSKPKIAAPAPVVVPVVVPVPVVLSQPVRVPVVLSHPPPHHASLKDQSMTLQPRPPTTRARVGGGKGLREGDLGSAKPKVTVGQSAGHWALGTYWAWVMGTGRFGVGNRLGLVSVGEGRYM